MEYRMQWNQSELVEQIVEGLKTATVWFIEWGTGIDEYNSPLQVGQIYTIYNGQFQARCKVRLTGVELTRWGAIPERLWQEDPAASGERSLEAFIGDHYDFFGQPDDTFEFLAVYFELIEAYD